MKAKDVLKYALTMVAIDAAQLAYTALRKKACDHFGIRVGKSEPNFTDPIKDAVWKEVKDVDERARRSAGKTRS